MVTTRKLVFGIVAFIAVLAVVLAATTVVGHAERTADRIVRWTGDSSFTPDKDEAATTGVVLTPGTDYVLVSKRAKRNKITGWKRTHHFHLISGTGIKKSRTGTHGCGRFTSETRGVNAFNATVVSATIAIHACYEGTRYAGKVANLSHVQVTSWGDAADWSLYSYKGVTNMVKGGGVNRVFKPLCWEYVYRRAYFKWSRGLLGIDQTATSWAALTVRGLGTYSADKYVG